MPTTVRSHAKINLGLAIGAPRPDGFHALATVYQTLELHDLVTVSARPAARTVLHLTSNDSRVPTDQRNTAWKMVALALEASNLTAEVEIHIEKRLPVQGGLGAGSANAVAALVGLEAELGIDASHPSRKDKNAARVGHPEVHGFPSFEQEALEGWGTQTLAGQQSGGSGWTARRLELAAQVGSDVPDWRSNSGAGPGAGGLSAAGLRAGLVRGGHAADGRLHAAGFSRLGRPLPGRGFDRRGQCG
jgi:hypothetical protein